MQRVAVYRACVAQFPFSRPAYPLSLQLICRSMINLVVGEEQRRERRGRNVKSECRLFDENRVLLPRAFPRGRSIRRSVAFGITRSGSFNARAGAAPYQSQRGSRDRGRSSSRNHWPARSFSSKPSIKVRPKRRPARGIAAETDLRLDDESRRDGASLHPRLPLITGII